LTPQDRQSLEGKLVPPHQNIAKWPSSDKNGKLDETKKNIDVFRLGIVMTRGIYMACSTATGNQFLFEDTDSYRHSKHIGAAIYIWQSRSHQVKSG
jgi:hypothetical protein